MHVIPATREEPEELFTSISEESWIERRARELASDAMTDQVPPVRDWLDDVLHGEEGFVTYAVARAVLAAALTFEELPTEPHRADFEYCAQRLRAEWVNRKWAEYRDAAVAELHGEEAA